MIAIMGDMMVGTEGDVIFTSPIMSAPKYGAGTRILGDIVDGVVSVLPITKGLELGMGGRRGQSSTTVRGVRCRGGRKRRGRIGMILMYMGSITLGMKRQVIDRGLGQVGSDG